MTDAPIDPATPDEGADAAAVPPRRSRVVMYTSIGVAVVIAVFIAVLAAASPSSSPTSPLIGKPAPAISGKALNGNASYTLAQFGGQWVLVNFSASWCVPCREETPQLQDFTNEHRVAGNGVVLAVAFDPTDVSNLAAYLRNSHATWPAVDDLSAEVAYGVSQIPQSYLVDPSGTVVAKFFGNLTAAQVDRVIDKASSVTAAG
jgi:cytochrome c biogenesis protein CcmG, thiol:disulfide interchange protein DsbE